MNRKGKTTYVLAFAGAALIGLGSPAAHAVDWVRADITCAPSVNVKLDWQNHFGSDPQFWVTGRAAYSSDADIMHNITLQFVRIHRRPNTQTIVCDYRSPKGDIYGPYLYTVKRQIHPTEGCKQINPRTLSCLVRER